MCLVFPENPDEEFGQISTVDELTEWRPGPPDLEGGSVGFGLDCLVDEAGDHVSGLGVGEPVANKETKPKTSFRFLVKKKVCKNMVEMLSFK